MFQWGRIDWINDMWAHVWSVLNRGPDYKRSSYRYKNNSMVTLLHKNNRYDFCNAVLGLFLVSVSLSVNYFDHYLRHVTLVKLLRKRLNPHVFQCARTIHASVLWNRPLYYDISQKENLERLFHKKKSRKYHNFGL